MKIKAAEVDRKVIVSALAEVAPIAGIDEVAGDANLLEMGYIDSTQFLDLVSVLEGWTGVEIDFLEHDPAEMTSMDGLVAVFRAQ
jgi:acyl carrier protein